MGLRARTSVSVFTSCSKTILGQLCESLVESLYQEQLLRKLLKPKRKK